MDGETEADEWRVEKHREKDENDDVASSEEVGSVVDVGHGGRVGGGGRHGADCFAVHKQYVRRCLVCIHLTGAGCSGCCC